MEQFGKLIICKRVLSNGTHLSFKDNIVLTNYYLFLDIVTKINISIIFRSAVNMDYHYINLLVG